MPDQVCEQCGGTGWRIVEREGMSAAERCACAARVRSNERERRAGIPPLYDAKTFENFSLQQDNPIAHRGLVPVWSAVRKYSREYPIVDRPGLLLIGETGTGKTHLAVAALKALLSRGFEGVFFDFNNLLDQIRASYDTASSASNREAYRTAMDSEILVLDDLGAHRTTGWMEDILTAIITHRCNHRRPLIATTNLPDPDAATPGTTRTAAERSPEYRQTLGERIGTRARSRLFEMCAVIRMPDVEDYRLRRR